MTSAFICSNGGTYTDLFPSHLETNSRVGWEISRSPDLIFHLSNHDLKPQREFGGFFNGTPAPKCRPAPVFCFFFFCQFCCFKKNISGKIKNLELHKVLSPIMSANSEEDGRREPGNDLSSSERGLFLSLQGQPLPH